MESPMRPDLTDLTGSDAKAGDTFAGAVHISAI
jgi:hypothetical protein